MGQLVRLLVCVVVLCSTGCARWVGVESARKAVFTEAVQAQRFPLPPEEAARRLYQQGFDRSARWLPFPVGDPRVGGCTRGGCIELVDEQGFTRVRTDEVLSEAAVTSLWQPLDPVAFGEFKADLASRVERKLREQEAAFEPRFGLTAGVLAGVSTDASSVGIGARVGVRRWHTIDLLSHAAVEYRYRGDHELSLRVGIEVARWSEGRFWSALGVPPASVSMFIGPVLRVPAARGGVRAGVGLHLTDWKNAPMFLEVFAETLFVGDQSRVTGVLTYGIGI